jgi:hypothetical protein
MGYCVHLSEQKFRIPADKIESCLDEILCIQSKYLKDAVLSAKKHVKYFEHLPPLLKFVELVNEVWGFRFTPNEAGDLDRVDYELEKMNDFDGFCRAIAPHVESGSYLEFHGEDGEKWRYVFRNGSWKQVRPVVVWPED